MAHIVLYIQLILPPKATAQAVKKEVVISLDAPVCARSDLLKKISNELGQLDAYTLHMYHNTTM